MNNNYKCPICHADKTEELFQIKDYFLTHEDFAIAKCKSCGFRYTKPRPAENSIGSYYESEEYISHSNAKKGVVNTIYQLVRNFSIKKKVNLVRKYINQGKVLDIGCGTGEFINALTKSGYDTLGIEPNINARAQGINNYHLDIREEMEINSIEASSIDVISMWHVLEHVYNLEDRVGQIKKIIKPDGIIIIAVPNPDSYDAKKYGKYWAAYDVPRHLYHFAKNDIVKLFEKFSIELIDTIPMKFDSYYVSMLSEKYKNGSSKNISAILNGFRSNLYGRSHQKNYSSLIYILKPKKA